MNDFNRPRPGESAEETKARQELFIRFIIDKHRWPRIKAIELLESLDPVALAYIGVEMRQAREAAVAVDYDPFQSAFEVR